MNVAAVESNIPRVSCFSHSLQLAVNDGLKQAEVSKTISVARKLVGHFNHSSVAIAALNEQQARMGESPLKLVQVVTTRWNSTFHMMKRLLQLRGSIYNVIYDDDITKERDRATLDIREKYWDMMKEVAPILEPLAEATQLLTKDTEPTSGTVYKILTSLLPDLKTVGMDSAPVAEMKIRIRESIMRRFKVNEEGKPHDEIVTSELCVSAAMDPRAKSLSFMSGDQRITLKEYLKGKLDEEHSDSEL